MPTGQHRRSIRGVRWIDTGRKASSARNDGAFDALSRRILELRSVLFEIRRLLDKYPEMEKRVEIVKRIDETLGTREWSIL